MDFRVNFKFKNAQTTRQQNFAHARDPPSRVDDDSATFRLNRSPASPRPAFVLRNMLTLTTYLMWTNYKVYRIPEASAAACSLLSPMYSKYVFPSFWRKDCT